MNTNNQQTVQAKQQWYEDNGSISSLAVDFYHDCNRQRRIAAPGFEFLADREELFEMAQHLPEEDLLQLADPGDCDPLDVLLALEEEDLLDFGHQHDRRHGFYAVTH